MQPEIIKQQLKTPDNFEFPFTPYQIQNEFMKKLYFVIEEGKLGIFESPTGTGKSLSIICGALRWLKDHELREKSELDSTINSIKTEKDKLVCDEDWLSAQAQEIELNKKLQQLQITVDKIQKNDEKIKKLKSKKKEINEIKFKDIPKIKLEEINQEEDVEFLLDELNQDDNSDNEDDLDDTTYESLKIYICSRTHSQISQLVHEVEKSPFGDDIRLVSLASRQSYCINSNVNKLGNPSLINERCLDLQKSSKGKTTSADNEGKSLKKKRTNCKCSFMQTKNIEQLKDSALLQIQDVEQLVQTGRKLNACPYYAARSAVTDAQVIVVPYNLILHQSTREASGIKLKNNVVIIDEAHNLLEALADMHSAQITGHQLLHAHNQLNEYRNKYLTKFSPQNLLYINQLLYIIGKLINVLGGKAGCSTMENCKDVGSKMWTLDDFVIEADIDHLNLYKILKFCYNSKICQKLNGFALKFQSSVNIHEPKKETGIKAFLKEISKNPKNEEIAPEQPATTNKEFISENIPRNPILVVVAFLDSLTHKCEDGRVICTKQTTIGKGLLKFLLLNPSSHFEQIVKECRSVLVAGGTMQPISEFKDRLFISSGAKPERIVEFSCDHIVPPENILPIVLCNGPTGKLLDFSYGSRNNKETLNELGRVLQNACNIVPGGMVCFFPSYDYEKSVYNHFSETNILKQLSLKKQIFREPKLSSDVDKVLTQYARAIKNCSGGKTGALMFSVVGGKLSEGLNFSDDLGRCVVVIGMPYPNIKSPELQEKMNYLNKNEGSNAGNIYYENLCMKAVNQCIGRAVRHRNDYANVLLLDKRYSREKTVKALPSWIQRSLVVQEKFGPAFASISKFFAGKKKT